MYVIYALVDPDEIWKICYIGLSNNLYDRFTQHLRDAEQDSLKAQWLKSLRERNRVPYCKVLEEVYSLEEARRREAYWIHFYKRLDMPLTNSIIPQVPQGITTDNQVREIAVRATRNAPNSFRQVPSAEQREKIIQLAKQGVRRRKMCSALGVGMSYYDTVKQVLDEEGL